MHRQIVMMVLGLSATPVLATDNLEILHEQIQKLKQEYQQRIDALEQRVRAAETHAEQAQRDAQRAERVTTPTTSAPLNSFNPNISVILEGRFAHFKNDPENYSLAGFQSGEEAGLEEQGLSIGHSELVMSANIDDKFYGQITTALASHEGSTEVELEEAFIQTLGLGEGVTIKAGRFFSGIGYLNQQHSHAWDFADAPLIYRGLFGNQLSDDGLQVSWLAPTDFYMQLGAELLRGERFPASGANHDGVGAYSLFAKWGGDLGVSHSWQLGLSHWAAEVENRVGEAHETHEEVHEDRRNFLAEPLGFTGDTRISALDFVWKWAPEGNPKNRHFKFQTEYFWCDEDGELYAAEADETLVSVYEGKQRGWYAQAVYQFMPQWRVGLRYDRLLSDHWANHQEVLALHGLQDAEHTPQRYSVMLDWSNSEYSRLRVQLNRDKSSTAADNQVFLQYIHSLGAHGAHTF